MTAKTEAAVLERDPARRAQMYEELQREHQKTSPFVIMFQDIEVIAERDNVAGHDLGPLVRRQQVLARATRSRRQAAPMTSGPGMR